MKGKQVKKIALTTVILMVLTAIIITIMLLINTKIQKTKLAIDP